ncbi:MAG: peptidoglycan DD-metalloendopeptidase family protein [Lachnospiraceae bacterium]|nr:peptidoglycan DD-metalloendopeptidase family protein [Lachnospiraceae bacterium]
MRKSKIVIALLLCLSLAFGMNFSGSAATFDDITSDSIKDKQNQIEKAEDQIDSLKNMLTDVKALKKSLEKEKKNLTKYVEELDKNLETIQTKIAELEQLISEKEKEIEKTQKQLVEALHVEESQYEAMKVRIQMMYEQGDIYYMDLIFDGGFAGLLNRLDFIEQVSEYDREKLLEYMINRELIEYCKMQLDADKVVLDEAKAGVEAERAALEELINEKSAQLTAFENDINNKAAAIKEYEAEVKEQTELIEALEAAVEEEKRQILRENGVVLEYDGGAFKFPVAKYTRVSSEFGNRLHPTLGIYKMHNGVDLASPTGTAIYAAYDGKVVAATYSSTMGNYVMINHGGGLYTIYMHASKLYVKNGDIVVRGDTIAAVGSTGRSTGPHLHFGVRLNGSYVNPWNYISK